MTGSEGTTEWSVPMQILLVMTLLTVLPAILLLMTSFTRIVIVLSILRQALGLPQTPSNQILVGVSLFLTFYIMSPVIDTIYKDAINPYFAGTVVFEKAIEIAESPLKEFMLSQTREADLALFSNISGQEVNAPSDLPLRVIIPSYVTSELKTAFEIGFLIFIPFLVIDLVVASVLMSMGMMMMSPLVISLPFKLMVFVLVDGWNLTLGTIAQSFGGL